MLGVREPEKYGHTTLKDAEAACKKIGKAMGVDVVCRHSNIEGELVTWIQEARKKNSGIVINAGGYSHTSVAILDALLLTELPVIEVHVTNIHAREKFRRRSLVSRAAKGVICGLGADGYAYGVQALATMLKAGKKKKR